MRVLLNFLFAILIIFSPHYLRACAVCFGKTDNANLGRAYSFGIFVLLGSTFLILAFLGMAVYRIEAHRASRLREKLK